MGMVSVSDHISLVILADDMVSMETMIMFAFMMMVMIGFMVLIVMLVMRIFLLMVVVMIRINWFCARFEGKPGLTSVGLLDP